MYILSLSAFLYNVFQFLVYFSSVPGSIKVLHCFNLNPVQTESILMEDLGCKLFCVIHSTYCGCMRNINEDRLAQH
jgi:hypothetical protein